MPGLKRRGSPVGEKRSKKCTTRGWRTKPPTWGKMELFHLNSWLVLQYVPPSLGVGNFTCLSTATLIRTRRKIKGCTLFFRTWTRPLYLGCFLQLLRWWSVSLACCVLQTSRKPALLDWSLFFLSKKKVCRGSEVCIFKVAGGRRFAFSKLLV